jgi:mannose-1-phosphate guanylyltransferase/phosphomannomutase
MRMLIQYHQHRQVDKMDGLKVHLDHGEWVHLSPNPEKPRFEVVAEAASDERAWAIVAEYRTMIEGIIHDTGLGASHKKDE